MAKCCDYDPGTGQSILPGIYSLDAGSLDEAVTRDYLLSQQADVT
jgi:Fe2+ transport system protein B